MSRPTVTWVGSEPVRFCDPKGHALRRALSSASISTKNLYYTHYCYHKYISLIQETHRPILQSNPKKKTNQKHVLSQRMLQVQTPESQDNHESHLIIPTMANIPTTYQPIIDTTLRADTNTRTLNSIKNQTSSRIQNTPASILINYGYTITKSAIWINEKFVSSQRFP